MLRRGRSHGSRGGRPRHERGDQQNSRSPIPDGGCFSRPGRSRTGGLLLRKQMLYPPEPRAQSQSKADRSGFHLKFHPPHDSQETGGLVVREGTAILRACAPLSPAPSSLPGIPRDDPADDLRGAVRRREFADGIGTEWRVWAVFPALPVRVTTEGEAPHVAVGLENGWLCFPYGAERRRVAPVPEGWKTAAEGELMSMCKDAAVVSPGAGVRR